MLQALACAAGAMSVPLIGSDAFAADAPDLSIRLVAAPDRAQIRRGQKSGVLRYTAQVIHGRPDAVTPSTGYLGPTLELRRGERVRIEFVNRIDEPSIVHWHGMIVPERDDGHPRFVIPPGHSYVYEFTVRNSAGTYLYHPHPDGRTGRQVYMGLAGLLIVRDDEEGTLGLPGVAHELALAIQDRRFDDSNALLFERSMMDQMTGVLGDTVLVNGVADAGFTVARRPYRLRLANVSNARIYKLAWSDGRPMQIVATDGGLFSRRDGIQTRPWVVLAPFQRIELIEDFGVREGGAKVTLLSQRFDDPEAMGGGMMGGGMMGGGMMGGGMMGGGMMGGGMMGGGMMGGSQGTELPIARFTVAAGSRTEGATLTLPAEEAPARTGRTQLHTRVGMGMMQGTLNGRAFEMTAVAADEQLPIGEQSMWTFSGDTTGHPMPHPIHIHGLQFRIVERTPGAPADLRDGLIDTGYHDTVLVFPGERVRLAVTPTEPGLFMYHCHNLEHEDGGMMRNCWFGPGPVKASMPRDASA
ncbi:MAG: multicopper oxidase domain-containing protein [Betaproteobacteria bacterium]|nr:multicopper oxidase domain-containing protein [Betaproteobacteria bacterium]